VHRQTNRFLIVTALWLLLGGDLVVAQPLYDPPPLSREQAVEQARSRHGGRVLGVRPLPEDSPRGPGYRVKLLERGEVREIDVPFPPPRKPPHARPGR